MKNFFSLGILLLALNAAAVPFKLRSLTSFADEFSFRDNRKNMNREKIYSASKDCCGSAPITVIEAFPETTGRDYKQIALRCDHCGVKEISSEQVQICRDRFTQLYKKLIAKEPPEKLTAMVGTESKRVKDLNSGYSLRFSLGSLKCDSKGGNQVRIDFFAK